MNTSGTLIDVFGISKQKLTCPIWAPWYLSCTWEEAQAAHSLHVRWDLLNKNSVEQGLCLLPGVHTYADREILQESETQLHLQLWEAGENENEAFLRREQQCSISLCCGTNSCLAAGGQGLITTCRGWGSCTQCHFAGNREIKKGIKCEVSWEGRKILSFKMQFQKKSALKVIFCKSDKLSDPSVTFLFARSALYL